MHLVTITYGFWLYAGAFIGVLSFLYLFDIAIYGARTRQPKNQQFLFLMIMILGMLMDSCLFMLAASTNVIHISRLDFSPYTSAMAIALWLWTAGFSFFYLVNNWMGKMKKGANVKEWEKANFIRSFLMIITLMAQIAMLGYCWPLVKIFYYLR